MSKSLSRNVVLLLTHSGDFFTVDRVADALSRRGVTPFRLNADLFPSQVKLSSRVSANGMRHVIEDAGMTIELDQVRAVWARKMWTPKIPDELDARYRDMCASESRAALLGFLDGLHTARWVNDINRDREAENKLLQLRIAVEVGLTIPPTLVTNDPGRAKAFFEEVDGLMVAKLLRPLSTSMTEAPVFVYTSRVHKQDLDDATRLRFSPMVFQRLIEKARELRIAYVAGDLFVGALDASGSSRGQIDWRLARPDECNWSIDEVPPSVAEGIRSLMTRLGLIYGAIDLIVTPEGEHVFLEVNPAGEWGMLERDLELPISEAIAGALLT